MFCVANWWRSSSSPYCEQAACDQLHALNLRHKLSRCWRGFWCALHCWTRCMSLMTPDGAMNFDVHIKATGSYPTPPRPSLEWGVSAPLQRQPEETSHLSATEPTACGRRELVLWRHRDMPTAEGMLLLEEREHESGPVCGTATTLQPFVKSFCGWPEPLAATGLDHAH